MIVLSAPAPSRYYANVSVYNVAAEGVATGGDWCDVLPLSEQLDVLTIGDVFGRGSSVAATMATVRDAILRTSRETHAPADVLMNANELVLSLGGDTLVSAIVAVLDHRDHTLTFANAGHPPPLLFLDGRASGFLEGPSADLPLGVSSPYRAADYVLALPKNALLVLYTDGITAHNGDPIMGERDLITGARFAYPRPDDNLARLIVQHVFASGRGRDDAAVITLRTAELP
jgi:serine phosphatase RsbU (regulator of sigma subunit)